MSKPALHCSVPNVKTSLAVISGHRTNIAECLWSQKQITLNESLPVKSCHINNESLYTDSMPISSVCSVARSIRKCIAQVVSFLYGYML